MKRSSFKVKILSVTLTVVMLAGSALSVWADEPEPAETIDSSVMETSVTSESSEGSTSNSSEAGTEGSTSGSSSSSVTETTSESSVPETTGNSSGSTTVSTDGVSEVSSTNTVSNTAASSGSSDENIDPSSESSNNETDPSATGISETEDPAAGVGTGLGAPPEPEINLVFNAEYTRFDLVFSGYEAAEGETLRAALWSDTRGQDDLEWVELTLQTDGKFKKTVNISDFADPGQLDIHVYRFGADGSAAYVAGKSDEIPTVTVGDLKLVSGMSDGKAVISSEMVSSPSGIKSARAAAWSKADQSDIYWYNMEEDTSGNWTFNIDLKNHNNNAGNYNVHMYAVDGNGFSRYAAGKTFDFSGLTGVLSVNVKASDETYTAEISGFSSAAPYNEIRVATWTDAGGQDDIKWHSLTVSGSTASVTAPVSDFKHFGTAYAHAYVAMANGQSMFLDGCEFTFEAPTSGKLTAAIDDSKGSFVLTLPDLQTDLPVKEVKMAVWSAADQSNLQWYTAVKSGTDYVVNGNLSNHKSMSGKYTAHVYVYPENAPGVCVSGTSMEFGDSQGEILFEDNGAGTPGNEEKSYRLSISNVVSKNGISQLQFAVWNTDNTGNIRWYTASKASDGGYYADVPISDFKALGQYVTHAYVTDNYGHKTYLDGKIIMNVTGTVTGASMDAENEDPAKGTFDVVVKGATAPSGIESMTFYVWTASDQSDMSTYTAAPQSDGSYKATVNIANHGYNSGTFYIHAYSVMGNGINLYTVGTNHTFKPDSIVFVTKPEDGVRYVGITVPAATPVQFAVWSDKNGLDDVKWYNSSETPSKAETTVALINHDGSGAYHVHAYSGSVFLGGTTFEVSAEEVKTGWVYEGGYKFYYKNGARLSDLRSIVGGPYIIFINRVTNTMNIFSYDYATGQYIIPVVCFACSCGIPGGYDTVAGNFTLGAKYRWKELMGPSYGQYVCNIVADYYIHSVAGYNMTSYNLNPYDYNMLGNNASHGCVRLNVANAKWVYENVPSGSPIYIYDSYDPGPYGKPGTIKIPATQNWDPTDPAITG